MKALFLLTLFLCFSCGKTISALTEHEKSVIMKANGLVSMEQWFPKEGTVYQLKFLVEDQKGATFVGKPQIIGQELVELTYTTLKALNNLEGLYARPLKLKFDYRNLFLMLEFLPESCQSVKSLSAKIKTKEFEQSLSKFRKKISFLEIVDLSDTNIMFCEESNYDPFYLIDAWHPAGSNYLWETLTAIARHNHWVREKLGRTREELTYLSKYIWGGL